MTNSFHERLYGAESKNLFKPLISKIIQLAQETADTLKINFSEPLYKNPKSLIILWTPSYDFQASAGVSQADENQHSITIFYGAAIEIYKDGALLPLMCTQHLTEEKYSELFTLLDYGNGPKQIFPPDLSIDDAKTRFFSTSFTWLYLHEQAHLFQNHGAILDSELGEASKKNQFAWEEFSLENKEPITGKEAWIRHAFELSADFEATSLTIQHLLIEDKQNLKKTTLWLFVAGLTCLFHRFYGNERSTHGGEAVGTHPDPAYRMRYAFTSIVSLLTHPMVKQYVPWANTSEDLYKVMTHAFNTANLYMQIAHFKEPGFPEFMSRTVDDSEDRKKYLAKTTSTWNSLRPKVMQTYFGWGDACVMNFTKAEH